jgi:hypothetical protein
METVRGWREKTMVDRGGAPLGRITHIYLDRVTEEPAWALVTTGQGGRQVFVPLVDAAEQEHQIRVPVERALVSDAPVIRAGRQLSKEDTARLHGHYGGAPELRWASARRAPGGQSARLRRVLGRARERAVSLRAVGSSRGRLLLAAGAAASSVVGGVLLARRRRGRQSAGVAAAVGRASRPGPDPDDATEKSEEQEDTHGRQPKAAGRTDRRVHPGGQGWPRAL